MLSTQQTEEIFLKIRPNVNATVMVALVNFVWILPIVTVIWLVASFITTYALSVSNNHTEPVFPYISYTGVEVPERGIFSFCVAVTSILLGIHAILRYTFLCHELKIKFKRNIKRWRRVNIAGLVLGLISSLGLLMVGCFQVDTMKPPHYLGAFMCFIIGVVYCWLQSVITCKTRPIRISKKINKSNLCLRIFQLLVCFVSTSVLIAFCVTKALYKFQKKKQLGTKWDKLRDVFLLSTSTEWILAVSVAVFLLTFIPDFRRIKTVRCRMTVREPEDNASNEKTNRHGKPESSPLTAEEPV